VVSAGKEVTAITPASSGHQTAPSSGGHPVGGGLRPGRLRLAGRGPL